MTRNIYFLATAALFLIAFAVIEVKLFHVEFNANYKLFHSRAWGDPLLSLRAKDAFVNIYTSIFSSRQAGLPQVRLYIPQKSRNFLMTNPPESTKKWQNGYMLYQDKKLKAIKVRNRGDHSTNWAFDKKSWRIKTKKKNLINNTRVFEYIVPQFSYLIGNYMAASIGERVGVLSPKSRLVELFINEKPYGVYYEAERIGESFLRNNDIMPVNLYKSEQVNADRRLMVDHNSFNNPALWSKLAVFNQTPEEDFSDLTYFLNLVHQAQSSEEDFARLKRVARFQDWARFSAYQTLTQDWANDRRHNLRIVIDPWRGTAQPIVHDGHSFLRTYHHLDKELNVDTHGLLALYNVSSEFLLEKYQILFSFIKDEIIPEYRRRVESFRPALVLSFLRNPHRMQFAYDLIGKSSAPVTKKDIESNLFHLMAAMNDVQVWLKTKIMGPPEISWKAGEKYFALTIEGAVPVDKLKITLASEALAPKVIAWDVDGDGKISGRDMLIPFQVNGNQVKLEAVFLANQVSTSQPPPNYGIIVSDFNTVATEFVLLVDTPLSPILVHGSNALTGEETIAINGTKDGLTPSRWNKPIIPRPYLAEQTWPVNIMVEKVLVVDNPVKLLAGTTIKMKPGASIIFKNRLRVEGTKEAPVIITSAVFGEPWGVVALHGPGTGGSVVSHLTIEHGSGTINENVRYIGMLSVHEAKNVEFRNLQLRKNHGFDDMMHVVYSEDIRLLDCTFDEAFSDGLDVDMSSLSIDNCKIKNSKNDAIDLMSSRTLIDGVELLRSGDKGVSVGEASEVLIFNSRLAENVIGVETKDNSVTTIINSDFVHNRSQIIASIKNWRYGTGGSVVVDKTIFLGNQNHISADKRSKIEIFDSTFSPSFQKQDKQVFLDDLSNKNGMHKAASPSYNFFSQKTLRDWSIKGLSGVRGIIQ